ncbi:hypothetical protein CEXT_199601, partial [Caerostris extrusa]
LHGVKSTVQTETKNPTTSFTPNFFFFIISFHWKTVPLFTSLLAAGERTNPIPATAFQPLQSELRRSELLAVNCGIVSGSMAKKNQCSSTPTHSAQSSQLQLSLRLAAFFLALGALGSTHLRTGRGYWLLNPREKLGLIRSILSVTS